MKAPTDSRREFRIHGMDCAEEVAILKRELGPLVGNEESLAFDILKAKMIVLPAAPLISAEALMEAVSRTGMRAEPWTDGPPGTAKEGFWQRRGRTLLTANSGSLLIAGFLVHACVAGGLRQALGSEGLGVRGQVPLLSRILYLFGIIAGAWYVAPKAWLAGR